MSGTYLVTVIKRQEPPPSPRIIITKKSQKKVTKISLSPFSRQTNLYFDPALRKNFCIKGKKITFDTRVSKYHKKCLEDF